MKIPIKLDYNNKIITIKYVLHILRFLLPFYIYF